MARIAGVDLPPQKRLWVGLTSIYGIGQERAKKLAEKAGVDHTKKIRDLTEDEINHLRQEIEKEGRVEGDLRKEIQMNIRRLIEIQAYRGIRHRRNLPVRGQRTHTNARTRNAARRGCGQEEGPGQEGLNWFACRGAACRALTRQRFQIRHQTKWSESWQKSSKRMQRRTRQ